MDLGNASNGKRSQDMSEQQPQLNEAAMRQAIQAMQGLPPNLGSAEAYSQMLSHINLANSQASKQAQQALSGNPMFANEATQQQLRQMAEASKQQEIKSESDLQKKRKYENEAGMQRSGDAKKTYNTQKDTKMNQSGGSKGKNQNPSGSSGGGNFGQQNQGQTPGMPQMNPALQSHMQNFMAHGMMNPGMMAIPGMGMITGQQGQQVLQNLNAQNSMLSGQVQMGNNQQNQPGFSQQQQQQQQPILVQNTPQASANNQRQLKVEDALQYLDKVKTQFGNQPMVYNQFLEIMKNFKAQHIDTPEVIRRVSELFKGHDNLILGFNTFLPPGFKIEIPPAQAKKPPKAKTTGTGRGRGGRGRGARSLGASSKKTEGRGSAVSAQVGVKASASAVSSGGRGSNAARQSSGKGKHGAAVGPSPDTAGEAKQHSQPVEFDHAINYVTKIKRRFSSDADTYKKFLDILHTYQKEQRSIKEVLDQVSGLFKDHPDLLKEFTYFLPDAVREEASEELAKRASKQAKALQRAQVRAVKRSRKAPESKDEVRVPQLERNLLGRIKAALVTREAWEEFIKCLDLFAQKLITRVELISLANDIFPPGKENLLEEFDRLLASRGATDNVTEEAWFSMPLSEIDFSNCTRCTPSYRKLPASYPKAPCSERTAMCRSVLNDTWVSVPTGSEDFTFKSMRKNQYEEALFKCEDDRYEIDMVIDSNQAAIRALEPLVREIETLGLDKGKERQFRYRLEKRTLSVIHLKAIARIYGDHGTNILELLRRNPAGALPIILTRLKQKDEEWRASRVDLNKQWKETLERNYYKSLDHKSFYFKQSDKKEISAKHLIAEIKEKRKAALAVQAGTEEAKTEAAKDATKPSAASPHVSCGFGERSIHKDIWSILCFAVEKNSDEETAEKVANFWAKFVHPLFGMPKSWLHEDKSPRKSLIEDDVNPATVEDAIPVDTKVMTPWGLGVVKKPYEPSTARYSVQLEWGVASLQPKHVSLETAFATADASSKPLTVMEDTDAGDDATEVGASDTYYGPVPVYLFFRLYHILYKRLDRAKGTCEKPEIQNRKIHKHPLDRTDEEKDTLSYSGELLSPAARKNGYEMVLALVFSLIQGTLDGSKFEDECRNLMGSASYFLYTIERLIQGIVKQLLLVVSDTKAMETIKALGEYRSSRSAADMAKVYQCNSAALMEHDGTCYSFQVKPKNVEKESGAESKSEAGKEAAKEIALINLEISVVDEIPNTVAVPASRVESMEVEEKKTGEGKAESDGNKDLVALVPVEIEFKKQLKEALEAKEDASEKEGEADKEQAGTKPFLSRSVQEVKESATSNTENGLRMKLALPFYKIVYVAGSEDVFRVIKASEQRNKEGAESARTSRFQAWWHANVLPTLETNKEAVEGQEAQQEEKKEETKDGSDKMEVDT